MKFTLHETNLQLVSGALERFAVAKSKRGMICPNHSNRHDPQVMFAFSCLVKEEFNYIAAREVFDWDRGLNGWWLQRLGAFSVVRGAADRESFKMSRKIIAQGKKKLVLFPEGEISRQNDTLMMLESGAPQLCFWAVEELYKANHNGQAPLEPVFLVPMALKYTFTKDIRPMLRVTLAILENKLGLKSAADKSLRERLAAVGEALLSSLEQEYEYSTKNGDNVNQRISRLRLHILQNAADQLHIKLPNNNKELDSVRLIRNALDDFIYGDEVPKSEYQRKLHDQRTAVIRGLYQDLDRIVNFIAIYDTYFAEHNTQERFADILERLEVEIIGGEPAFKGPRRVLIDVGRAINMSENYTDYKANKRAVLSKITEELGCQISEMLKQLEKMRSPILVT